jgi:hypothetical protein
MSNPRPSAACCFAGLLALSVFAVACAGGGGGGGNGGSGGASGGNPNGGSGGSAGAGGSSSSGGSGGQAGAGGMTSSGGSGGVTSSGGSQADAPIASGGSGGNGSGGNSGSGGSTSSGGSAKGGAGSGGTRTGGASTNGGSSGSSGSGGTGSGGAAGAGGTTSAGGTTGTGGSAAVDYLLPPPDRCHDQDYINYDYQTKTGCLNGDKTTDCQGKCQVINACSESTTDKPNADVTFMCPRNLLFSPEMEQAVKDDGLDGFHYAVVGHDVDKGGIDGQTPSACCQCYQLVYAWPSVANDRQVQVNPDNPNPPASAIPVPAPLIVQAFNTAATPQTFDVYMPAGGLGANNACALLKNADGSIMTQSRSGQYMYTSYPPDGQPGNGGLKPASLYSECKTTDKNWVTTATLSSQACVQRTTDACNKIASTIPGLTDLSRKNCLKANTIDSFYHLNWSVYAMRVECPEHLTRVTGCRLASQGLPAVKANVKTAADASKDSQFLTKTGSTSNMYETTTMEDCCRPSCAAINWISGKGLTPDPDYRAFYSCDVTGKPYTQ